MRNIISSSHPDVLVFAETKIDESFPTSQFLINEYNELTRCDRSAHGGGLIEYIRSGIVRKRLKNFELKSFESICSEISVKNVRWFLLSVYRSPKYNNIKNFFSELTSTLNLAATRYDNIVIMGDINIDVDDTNVSGYQDLCEFMNTSDLTNVIKEKTCITWSH
jgi:exonuclease III